MNSVSKKQVFIVGAPRSGTTLLQLLIGSHPDFYSVPETHFFTYVLPPLLKQNKSTLLKKDLETIIDRLSKKPALHLTTEEQTLYLKKATGHSITYAIDLLIRLLGQRQKKQAPYWVEKTPRHVLYLEQIKKYFPHARIINIVRDPRDVCSSFASLKKFSSSKERELYLFDKARKWNQCIVKAQKSPLPLLTVQYENLVLDLEKNLKTICQFLDCAYQKNYFVNFADNFSGYTVPMEQKHKALCAENQIIKREGIWKERLSPKEIRLIETLCLKNMKLFGYQPSQKPGSATTQSLVLWGHRISNKIQKMLLQ